MEEKELLKLKKKKLDYLRHNKMQISDEIYSMNVRLGHLNDMIKILEIDLNEVQPPNPAKD